jgi:hypothetical protein
VIAGMAAGLLGAYEYFREQREAFADTSFLGDSPRRKASKIGRNDPCPCGSGRNTRNAAAARRLTDLRPRRLCLGTNSQNLALPSHFACYTNVRCVLQVLLLIWEGRLPLGNQAHWGMDASTQRSSLPENCPRLHHRISARRVRAAKAFHHAPDTIPREELQ